MKGIGDVPVVALPRPDILRQAQNDRTGSFCGIAHFLSVSFPSFGALRRRTNSFACVRLNSPIGCKASTLQLTVTLNEMKDIGDVPVHCPAPIFFARLRMTERGIYVSGPIGTPD